MDGAVAGLALTALSVVMLGVAIWSWLGRGRAARWWLSAILGPSAVMGVLPGLGFAIMPAGLADMFGRNILTYVGWLMFVGICVLIIGLFFPRLLAPPWYRRMNRKPGKGDANMPDDGPEEQQLHSHYQRREGFWIQVPHDWLIREDINDETALIAVEPDTGEGFRSSVVVTVGDVPDGMTFDNWQLLSERANEQSLEDYFLLDAQRYEQHGHEMHRRLAHHAVDGKTSVTIEQWSTIRSGRGYTLTASAESLKLRHVAGLFNRIADEFTIDELAARR